jgi:hypothetical protein
MELRIKVGGYWLKDIFFRVRVYLSILGDAALHFLIAARILRVLFTQLV